MARNRTVVQAPADAVFAVLSDPRAYSYVVVGNKRVRRFEPPWPERGSAFHHTLGVGPILLRDLTRVEEVEEGRRLVLAARMMPFAVNRVVFTLHATAGTTQVDVEERPVEGPVAALWNPVLDALMWLRNREMLRRLRRLAEDRDARRRAEAEPAAPVGAR